MKKKLNLNFFSFVIIFLMLVSIFILYNFFYTSKSENKFHKINLRVAHAGGVFNKNVYTNSIEALDLNSKYFDLFELDLKLTSDRKIVCIHDWEENVINVFGKKFETNPPSYREFTSFVKKNKKFKNCTAETLNIWLNQNDKKYIITDVKDYENNYEVLKKLKKKIKNADQRIIPQIYSLNNYNKIKSLGYKRIIYTLYMQPFNEKKIIESLNLRNLNLFAITLPKNWIKKGLGLKIKEKFKFKIYTYTINDMSELLELKLLGVDEIYTQTLFNK